MKIWKVEFFSTIPQTLNVRAGNIIDASEQVLLAAKGLYPEFTSLAYELIKNVSFVMDVDN